MRIGPVVVMLFLLSGVGVFAESQSPAIEGNVKKNQTEHKQPNQTFNSDKYKTPSVPISVNILPAPDADAKAAKQERNDQEKAANERKIVWATIFLAFVTAILAIFTGALWWVTLSLSKSAAATSKQQMIDVQKSIAETARAAAAMERVAGHMGISARASTESVAALKERTAQQMRAYLSVSIGGGIFQERHKDLRFEVKPTLLNSGNTPAHKITYWAKAEILPFPLPDSFNFPPIEDTVQSSLVLGPHQSIVLNAMVNYFLLDEEVESVKRGIERRPHIWGIVTYTDVFGDIHTTKFSHSIYWLGPEGNEIIAGNYSSRHNEAD